MARRPPFHPLTDGPYTKNSMLRSRRQRFHPLTDSSPPALIRVFEGIKAKIRLDVSEKRGLLGWICTAIPTDHPPHLTPPHSIPLYPTPPHPSAHRWRFEPLILQEEFEKLENKGKLLQARIFELECMRDKGLTAAEAAGIVADIPDNPTAALNGRPPLATKAD